MVSKQLSAVHEEWGKLHLWSWCKVSELYSHLATSVTCEKKLTNYRQLKREGNKTYHYISYHIIWYNTRNNNGYVGDIWKTYQRGFSDNINIWYISDIENKVEG